MIAILLRRMTGFLSRCLGSMARLILRRAVLQFAAMSGGVGSLEKPFSAGQVCGS
jgi:hypothetical protein